MNVIAKKAKRFGAKVNRKVQSRIDEVNRKQNKKKSLKSLRETNVRSDLMLLPASGEQMLFRVTHKLNLSKIHADSRSCMQKILEEEGMIHWEFPTKANVASTIHTLQTNQNRLLTILKNRPEFSHWYFQYIKQDGKPAGAPRLVREINGTTKFDAVRLYERVAFSPTSNFRSGSSQGVLLSFWTEAQLGSNESVDSDGYSETIEQVIVAPIWNENATLLPNPVSRQEEFHNSLEKAMKTLSTQVDFAIDAVYTWVDGSDNVWQAQKASALNVLDAEEFVDEAVSDARFADHDELKYSLRSIAQFAPWIRKIWIVSAGQTPKWLNMNNPRVEVVSHEDIWPDEVGLPNFNSHAIESNLHRIKGLADHYLYFNDDFFLTRPLDPGAFFFGNGLSKVFFSRAMVEFTEVSTLDNASSIAAKNARTLLDSRGYQLFSRKFFHTPSALNRKIVEQAESEFPDAFEITRSAQFRDTMDIAVSGSFYFNYALATGSAVPGQIKYDYIDPATESGRDRMKRMINRRDKDCIVINDGSTPETDEERLRTDRFIRESLDLLLPAKSEFEL
ncbi:Stealth CR1 domain-containing protein [Glutamicibacter sp. JL.03c]|uniref:Stealth CR1 domain-containing protein n=1 Tax=Glutamicibacter sp. JL.03c TaxID=2984842 RepID=UPI0021F7BE10|nr:Stealth CR1 domain-containing protein [Glutamicibacter sp. JL.03c]UYQ78826.1 Stealth CR1 domain-containing protein [Glutamicibacter sp. JL.03c]